jgi:hypothetical protein
VTLLNKKAIGGSMSSLVSSVRNIFNSEDIKIQNKDSFIIKKGKPISRRELRGQLLNFLDFQGNISDLDSAVEVIINDKLEKKMLRSQDAYQYVEAMKSAPVPLMHTVDSFRDTEVVETLPGEDIAMEKAKQYFFSDGVAKKGFILVPSPEAEGEYEISEYEVSIASFQKAFDDINVVASDGKEIPFFNIWQKHRHIVGEQIYVPYGKSLMVYSLTKDYLLNTFRYPSWWKRKDELKYAGWNWQTIDPVLRCFFIHLFPDDSQRAWVLNWVKVSPYVKLSTYLTLIGQMGVGKGILVEYVKEYHGANNYNQAKLDQVIKQFNAILNGKTLVFLDEADLAPGIYSDIKRLANKEVTMEKKNVDAYTQKLHANIVWAANDYNSMRGLEPNDRRFSIPDISHIPLIHPVTKISQSVMDPVTGETVTFTQDILNKLWSDKNLFDQFIGMMLSMKGDVNKAMTIIPQTANLKHILMQSRPDHVLDFLDSCQNIHISPDKLIGGDDDLGLHDITTKIPKDYDRYTYLVSESAVCRLKDAIKSSRSGKTMSWRFLRTELLKVPIGEVCVVSTVGTKFALYIRHRDHETIKKKLKEWNNPVEAAKNKSLPSLTEGWEE